MSEEIIVATKVIKTGDFYRKANGDLLDMQVVADHSSGELVKAGFAQKYPDANIITITDGFSIYSFYHNSEGIAGLNKKTLAFVYSSGAYEMKVQYILSQMQAVEEKYRTPRILMNAIKGEEYALKQMEAAEELLAPLREELKALNKGESND